MTGGRVLPKFLPELIRQTRSGGVQEEGMLLRRREEGAGLGEDEALLVLRRATGGLALLLAHLPVCTGLLSWFRG